MNLLFDFNPIEVGKLEVSWWKAHHAHDKAKLVDLLIKEHTALYSISSSEAKVILLPLFEAVKYHDTRDWKNAIKKASEFYELLKKKLEFNYDSNEMGKLEVGWWKIHDDLEFNLDKSKLEQAFTKLYATEFNIPEEKLTKAGEFKAQATYEHDLAEDPKTSEDETEKHWQKAEELLTSFYKELKSQNDR